MIDTRAAGCAVAQTRPSLRLPWNGCWLFIERKDSGAYCPLLAQRLSAFAR